MCGRVGVYQMAKIGSAYTEDWLPVESIQNGMIVCSDKIKLLELR